MVTRKINVLIVDDYDLVREGLTYLLQTFPDIEVVGGTGDGRMAVTLCAAYHPDVVLMDMFMPRMSGATTTRLIHDTFPHIQIIALSSSVDEALIYEVLKAGAISYLLKSSTVDEVVVAICAAYDGKSTLAPEAAAILISVSQRHATIGFDLTKREREILKYMANGLKNGDIAEHLVISLSTVKNHVSNIFLKLATNNRAKAVALAVEHELYANT